ncbi:MAG: hypothetical protein ACLP8S_25945 [Solirubrobacteraceae bacterium]
MTAILGHFKRRYGASPLHLLAHIVAFAIVAYTIVQLLGQKHWVNWAGMVPRCGSPARPRPAASLLGDRRRWARLPASR